MKPLGITILIAGVLVAVIACFLPISVSNPSSYSSVLGYTPPADVINLGLLQRQELAFLGGCAVAIVGAILTGAGAIVEQIGKLRPTRSRRATPALNGDGVQANPTDGQLSRWANSTPEEIARAKSIDRAVLIGAIGVACAILLAVVLAGGRTAPSSDAAAVIANADAMADNMEMEADNLEALADETGRAGR